MHDTQIAMPTEDKSTILIQDGNNKKQFEIDQKHLELFNKADIKEEGWLQKTFHSIGLNIKSVFHNLFLPQL